jgi:hypothetical protein
MAIVLDGTGSITGLTSGAGIAAAALSGQVPDANASSGSVIQVVSAENATTQSTTSTSYVDTNLVASITPSFTSSRILVIVQASLRQISGNTNGSYGEARVFRGAQAVGQPVSIGTRENVGTATYDDVQGGGALMFVDTPTSTDSVTYRLRMRSAASAVTTEINSGTGGSISGSTITLMEIAA